MNIQEIYDKYRIPPWLQMHQLRVAAIGQYIAQQHPRANIDDVIASCLLHDIGAIVKFDFSLSSTHFAGHYTAEEAEYWRSVQRDFHERYGIIEHDATDAILTEINVRESVRAIVHNTGFKKMREILERDYTDALIVQYADMCVSPTGITSLDERLADVKMRYADHLKASGRYDRYHEIVTEAHQVKERVFAEIVELPSSITANLESSIESLREFPVL